MHHYVNLHGICTHIIAQQALLRWAHNMFSHPRASKYTNEIQSRLMSATANMQRDSRSSSDVVVFCVCVCVSSMHYHTVCYGQYAVFNIVL